MTTEDSLIVCLKALCLRFSESEDPLDGRYEVAKRSGLSEQYLYQIIAEKPMANGSLRSVGKNARAKITSAFPDWLNPEKNISDNAPENDSAKSKKIIQTSPGENRLPIRRALFKLSAGVSGYEIEYENGESEPIFMARRWFEQNHYRPEKLVALKVNGRSMEPKMYDGDLVIINTESSIPRDGRVFAVNYEGEMVIKRMKRDAGQWFITSDNPDKVRFGDKVCAESCFLLGEVVYLQTETI